MDRLEATRYAGKINQLAIKRGFEVAKKGVTLLEIDAAIEKCILDNNCQPVFKGYKGYPATSCLSPNDIVVHGIPNEYSLKDGDILTIDVGCSHEGWMIDAARTRLIEDPIKAMEDPENYDWDTYHYKAGLIFAAESVLEAELSVIKNGCSLLDIIKAAELAAKSNFFSKAKPSPPLSIYPQWGGHEIGQQLHMGPFIPNCIDPSLSGIKRWRLERQYDDFKLKTGQTICLEPVVTFGKTDIMIDRDGWTVKSKDGSLAAHTENCILITETGYETLS